MKFIFHSIDYLSNNIHLLKKYKYTDENFGSHVKAMKSKFYIKIITKLVYFKMKGVRAQSFVFSTWLFIYCKRTIVPGIPILVVFRGYARQWNLIPNKMQIPFDEYTENLKTTESKIHEFVFLPKYMKNSYPWINVLSHFISKLNRQYFTAGHILCFEHAYTVKELLFVEYQFSWF